MGDTAGESMFSEFSEEVGECTVSGSGVHGLSCGPGKDPGRVYNVAGWSISSESSGGGVRLFYSWLPLVWRRRETYTC